MNTLDSKTDISNLYYNIGKTIKEKVLKLEKPEYGKAVIKELSGMLMSKYGRGYSYSNLYRMVQLSENFDSGEIFATVSQKLSWSHFIEILKIDNFVKRKIYLTMCMHENWSVRVLRERINSALYERTLISKKPEETIMNELNMLASKEKASEDLFFRDPYVLDFLYLKDTYSEKDLENSILNEL